jgi:alkylation response protein AidB-like acyl-CoA dehydrogenase
MKFELSEDQALLRNSTRDFVTSELPLEKTKSVMEHSADGYESSAWRSLADMGYIGLALPAAVGGQGLGTIELAIVLEEMGRVCMPGPFLDAVLASSLLAAARGQEKLAADVVAGKSLVAIARQDAPFSGTNATATTFTAGRVRGTKYFVPFAAKADALLVTTPQGVVLVRAPYDVVPLQTFDLSQRFGEVKLDHEGTLVGGVELLERVDLLAAVGASAMMLGIMSRALELTLGYVQTRQAFKRPIGAFQALQHRMADMLIAAEQARSMAIFAASPAAWPRIIYCGSIRTEEYATWLAENATGTSRLRASLRFGSMIRYGIW